MRKTTLIAACVLAAVLPTREARSAGFYLGEQDSAASARGLAVAAWLQEASTIFYNPAGMAFLHGWNASAGVNIVVPDFNYSDPAGIRADAKAADKPQFIPHAYLSYTINEMVAVGAGVNVPFGMALTWPEDFAGAAQTQKLNLQAPTIYLGLAFRPLKQLSIGATMNITPATVELARRFTLVDPNGNFFQEGGVRLSASAVGVGGTVGIMARPVDWLHLGFNYMSRMKLTFDDGEAHFEQPADFDNSVFRDQRGTTSLTMPDTFTFGVGAELGPNAYLEFDYNYTLWETYKELEVRFNDDTTGQLSKPLARNWKNTSTYRLGFEYRFDMGFALRASFVYDESPAPASTVGPDLPDNSRLVGSLGLGYLHRPLGVKVDAYYMLSYFLPRTVDAADGNPFPARYESMAHLFGVTVGYAEPRKPPPEEKPLPPDPALPPDAPPGEPPDDTP